MIIAVVVVAPAPVTTPVELTLATPILLLAQVPPELISVKAVDEPEQTLIVPVIVAGIAFTVSDDPVAQPSGSV